jgi:3,4-dihydroxy 2-butanone 4-phosphate synthase/GTP cyclohydrolase II
MASTPELERFALRHHLPLISVSDLRRYRQENETLIQLVSEAHVPTPSGTARALVYASLIDHQEHLALVFGDPQDRQELFVGIHHECLPLTSSNTPLPLCLPGRPVTGHHPARGSGHPHLLAEP